MKITAKELAKILGLSEAAVSTALNNKPGVSTATRNKVIETAERLGYDFSRIRENSILTSSKGDISFVIYKNN